MSSLNLANPWIVSAREAARSISPWLALAWTCILSGVTVLVLPAFVWVWAPYIYGDGFAATALNRATLYVVLFAGFFATALVGVFWERRPARQGSWRIAPAVGIGLVIGMGCLVTTLCLACLVGSAHLVVGRSSAVFGAPGIVWAGLLVLFQCSAEEVLFRGWLQPILSERWGVWTGVTVVAVTFGISHSVHTPSFLAIVNATLAGLLFGLLALRSAGLAAPIAAHFGYNWAEQSIFGLTPNPGVDDLGSVFNFDLGGAPILSGGHDELNGSILLSLALGLAIYLVVTFCSRLQKEQASAPV